LWRTVERSPIRREVIRSAEKTDVAKKIVERGWRPAIVLLVLAVLTWSSDQKNAPRHLPGASLGWVLLFHIERASALLAAVGVVTLIGWRAMHGEFPVKFGNIEYDKKAANASARATESQERRLRILEALGGLRDVSDVLTERMDESKGS
jgi:hypothetical protein